MYQLELKFNEALKPRTQTDYIILHHSGVKTRHTAEDIHQLHMKKGWAGIGYHYFINKEGEIFECRPRNTVGAHAKGYNNNNSIGICFEGDFNKETMKEAQRSDEVIRFLFFLRLTYPDSKIVFCDELKKRPMPTIKGFQKDELWKQYGIFHDGFHSERARVFGEECAQTFYDWWDNQLIEFGLYEPDEEDI